MNRIVNLVQFHALQQNTWVYGIIVALIAVVIAWGVATIISWQGGQDTSYIKRRIWFAVIGLLAASGFFLFNDLYVKDLITKIGWQSMFVETNIEATGLLLGIYLGVSLIWMLIRRHSKFGSILGKEKDKK